MCNSNRSLIGRMFLTARKTKKESPSLFYFAIASFLFVFMCLLIKLAPTPSLSDFDVQKDLRNDLENIGQHINSQSEQR